ncbi:3-mercaptopyruvate sulfurtransferase [Hyphococcus luteus]|uniref:Sulfurtransferase n=1 Tax=Hyphococcus luteus TaxID=2058213 RepID=A0A2S7K2G5_9PROT|nr:3-mercaptopyruvate sulfurtransferase [Marinicaulis flavus]PQA86686.1 3-mercaptopyruvate sulfurtransferase [Marinicaulis flavus]
MTFGPLVSTDWLAENLGEKDLKIIDGSWRMPGEPPAIENYKAQHIPGAVFFDIDAVADASTDLPHMLPEPEQFEAAVSDMGISENDRIVVYDEKGLFSAARVWWTFRVMGHENVAVLDGGLPKWLQEGKPVTADETVLTRTTYKTEPKPHYFADAEDVRAALAEGAVVLDARSEERFSGRAGEPRAGLRAGHMPGASCLPFALVLDDSGRLRPREELELLFANAGAEPGARVITSCGSGVTAAILFFALETIGARHAAVYDGSWSEWGDERHDDELFPVVADA